LLFIDMCRIVYQCFLGKHIEMAPNESAALPGLRAIVEKMRGGDPFLATNAERLLAYVLARVFAEGTRMREDLAGTV
jgi:hypothetical protein